MSFTLRVDLTAQVTYSGRLAVQFGLAGALAISGRRDDRGIAFGTHVVADERADQEQGRSENDIAHGHTDWPGQPAAI